MQDDRRARRILLVVAYDGTNYFGWQIQKNMVTVEETLNEAISRALGEKIRILGASRTDSGVHALGNVAVFDTDSTIPGDKFCYAINKFLPRDIVVTSSKEVSREFHPRYRPTKKTYRYIIYNSNMRNPLRERYTGWCYSPLSLPLMKEGAAYLVGTHDFASFCSAGSDVESTVRTIDRIELSKEDSEITLIVKGNGFLYHMVRLIAGVLMQVGKGVYPPSEVKRILERKERGFAKPTAPASGLTLMEIEYPRIRCAWTKNEASIAYHDTEWGVPCHDDRKLFELLILEGQQAGLSWETILKKREAMRIAFSDFNPEKIARYTEEKKKELLQNPAIIRNRRKIDALVQNAKAFLAVQKEFGSFDSYIWAFVGKEPIVNHWKTENEIPAKTDLSDRISLELKKRGFCFVGSTICYSFLQAAGLINDHVEGCFRHGELRDFYEIYEPEADFGKGKNSK